MQGKSHLIVLTSLLVAAAYSISSVCAKGTYGSHYRSYSLHSPGPLLSRYSPGRHMGRHRNYCAYIVERNITCAVQDSSEAYVKVEYQKCLWGQKCPVTKHQTFYRPKYRIGYKTVTELEWRCCPGFSGSTCQEGPTSLPGILAHPSGQKGPPGPPFLPHPGLPTGQNVFPNKKAFPHPKTSLTKTGFNDNMIPSVVGERIQYLEEKIQHLSTSFETLQTAVNRINVHLNAPERVQTVVHPFMNPDTRIEFGVIPDATLDIVDKAEATYPRVEDLMGKVSQVTEEINSRSGLLGEVRDMVLDHDSKIKHLLESARPSPLTSFDLLDEYVRKKFDAFRAELLDGFDKKLFDVKSSFDDKIKEITEHCVQNSNTIQQLQMSIDGKESDMKKDIVHLETQVQGLTVVESCCSTVNYFTDKLTNLENNLIGLSDYQNTLQTRLESIISQSSTSTIESIFDSRFEEIESRMNMTERDAGDCCHNVEGDIRLLFNSEVDGFKAHFNDKFKNFEDRFWTVVDGMNNASLPVTLDGNQAPFLETAIHVVRKEHNQSLATLETKLNMLEGMCSTSCSSFFEDVETIKTEIESSQDKNQDLIAKLDYYVDLVKKVNSSVYELQKLIEKKDEELIQGEITLLKINLNSVNKSVKGLKDSVNKYSSAVLHVNSSLEQHAHKVADEVYAIHDTVNTQKTRLMHSSFQLQDLRGQLLRLKNRLMSEVSNCKHFTDDIEREVSQFDSRVNQVESMCNTLGVVSGDLEDMKDELEKQTSSLFDYLGRINGTLITQTSDIARMNVSLQDCQSRVNKVSELMNYLTANETNH
ncbi:EMILIN-3 [Protopterus annectens]|uniref:EMILIN-3 n=1 Tax=Protopterus annectens TaxID=7888 RepID=UPI001CFA0608|nr:EMILIN-3 [Protopterus annectens]